MNRLLIALLSFACAAPAQAVFLDCLFFDGYDGESGSAPAAWKGNLQVHNCARRTVVPSANPRIPPLRWSSSIAGTAQAHANQCVWQHSGTPGLGENLYAVAPWAPAHAGAATAWASEAPYYNYAANSCNAPTPPGTCGHYTQMVWRGTTQLGCGIRDCSTGSPFGPAFPDWTIVVCNYSPPGNIGGQRPY